RPAARARRDRRRTRCPRLRGSTRGLPLEVLPVLRRRRAALALVLRAQLAASVRRRRRLAELDEGDLPDLHARIDRHREVRDVRELERDMPVPAGIDEAGRRVDQETETTQ